MRYIFLHSRRFFYIRMMLLLLCGVLIVQCLCVRCVYADGEPELKCPSAILMDSSSGQILYEKNIHERRPLASVTKIMTMLLAMEEIDSGRMSYDDIITGSAYAKSMGGSTIFLDEGEQLSVRDILKGIAVSSGNDAAVAMGEHISGSNEGFVAKMNERASQLGMENTHFVNCNGLDADDHYSTAYDIALMSRELLKHPDIHAFTTIWMDSLRDGKFTLSNTNKLIRFYEGATGLKTGSTSQALFCVSATAKRDNLHLIAVIMASPTSKDRVSDASKLLNYGFANYAMQQVTQEGEVICEQDISKGVKKTTRLIAKNSFDILGRKGEKAEIEKRDVFTSDFQAPVTKGETAGKIEYYKNGEKIGENEIVFFEDIEKIKFSDMFMRMVRLWAAGGTDRTTDNAA